jgi:1-acyl-sn-glycerol-3-phosphate acyltransferase
MQSFSAATLFPPRSPVILALTEALVSEILLAFGLGRAAHAGILRTVAQIPAGRFTRLVDQFDQRICQDGLPAASRWITARFIRSVRVRGRLNLPEQGPLLVASNHPGALDSVSMLGAFPRDDTRIFVSGSPFFKTIPSSKEHCIFVEDRTNVDERRRAIRLGIAHLQKGGSLLIFPTGRVDPEPACSPGSLETMQEWSPSLEILLRKAPQTKLVLAAASDVLMHRYIAHPLTRLQPPGWKRQRLAEYLQLIHLLLSRKILALDTLVSFGAPLPTECFSEQLASRRWMEEIVRREQALLAEHMAARAKGFEDGEKLW